MPASSRMPASIEFSIKLFVCLSERITGGFLRQRAFGAASQLTARARGFGPVGRYFDPYNKIFNSPDRVASEYIGENAMLWL